MLRYNFISNMPLHFQGLYVRQHFSSYHFLLKSHAEKQNKILMRKMKKESLDHGWKRENFNT